MISDTFLEAAGKARIRELVSAIRFAQSEPARLPEDYDEDTGETAPVPNWKPAHRARQLARTCWEHPVAHDLMKAAGWTDDTELADWETMLARLPTS